MRRGPQWPGRASNTPGQGVPQRCAAPAVADRPGGDVVPVAADQRGCRRRGNRCSGPPGRGRCRCRRDASPAGARSHARGSGSRRRGRHVHHLVVGVEGREVERHVGAEVLHEPGAERLDLAGASLWPGIRSVVTSSQTVGLVPEVDQRVEHRLERARAELPVEVLGEALEVDVGRVQWRRARRAARRRCSRPRPRRS